MAYIKYNGKVELVSAIVLPVRQHIIRITTDTTPVLSGFRLYLDSEEKYPLDNGEYQTYTTLYRQGEGWFELSDDASVYIEPEPESAEELAEKERQQEIAMIRLQIVSLKNQIADTDYQIVKTYEYSLVGKESEYNIESLHEIRQNLRNQINELEQQLTEYTVTT